jgi:membrane protease YdiL (CAAX protease family)/uncharacterized RDD family membrane protein YckC
VIGDEFTAPAPAGARPVEYASFSRRLGAALLDSAVWIIGLIFFNPFVFIGDSAAAALVVSLVVFSAWFNYFAFCEWRWGQTIGKNATGIRVLPLEGGPLSWQAAAIRNLLRLVDLPLAMVGADYVIVRSSERHQRLGDRVAKTIVVREQPAEAAAAAEPAGAASTPVPPPGDGAPTAAEIFGDAARALGRHPAAGSSPRAVDAREGEGPQVSVPPPTTAAPAATPAAAGEGGGISARVSWTPGLAFGGILIALLAAIVLSIPIAIADPNVGTDDASVAANTLAQLIQTAVLIAVPLAIAYRSSGRLGIRDSLDRLGIRKFKPSAFGWMGVAVIVYLVIATICFVIINPHQQDISQDFGPIPLQIVMIAIAAPISEELSFRGFLFGGLRSRLPAIASALISGALFGALHAPGGVGVVPQLIAFGAILALLYEKTGSIVPGLLLHMLNNTVGLIAS